MSSLSFSGKERYPSITHSHGLPPHLTKEENIKGKLDPLRLDATMRLQHSGNKLMNKLAVIWFSARIIMTLQCMRTGRKIKFSGQRTISALRRERAVPPFANEPWGALSYTDGRVHLKMHSRSFADSGACKIGASITRAGILVLVKLYRHNAV